MKYKNIRNNARKLYRQNFKLYILIVLMVSAVLMVNYMIGTLKFLGAISVIIRFCVTVLIYPLTIGNMVFFYSEYLGEHGRFTDIFRFYRNKSQLLNALSLGAIITLPSYVNTHSGYLFKFLGEKYPSIAFIVQTVPGILVGLVYWIFFLRTYPAPFIFGIRPVMKPFSIIKTCFSKTKGYFFDYILFSLSVMWPMILAGFLLAFAVALPIANGSPYTLLLVIFTPFLIFFMPYLYLCIAGFSSEIISNGEDL